MKKERFYTIVIIALLLLNIGTLGFLYLGNGSKQDVRQLQRPERPGDFIINALKLDEQQQKEFLLLGRRHRVRLDSVQDNIKRVQNEMFRLVSTGELDSTKTSELIQQIQEGEAAKHMITIAHFEEIRQILKPDQVPLFKQFMQELGNRIIAPNHPPLRRGGPPPPRR